MIEDHHTFGAGVEPRFDVELLKGLPVSVGEGDQSHEQHHGSGVLPGGVQADVGIGCARPTGNHRNSRQLIHFTVSLGHVGGTALMTANDGFDGGVVKTIQNVKEALTRYYMGPPNAVGRESVNNDVPGRLTGCLKQVPPATRLALPLLVS